MYKTSLALAQRFQQTSYDLCIWILVDNRSIDNCAGSLGIFENSQGKKERCGRSAQCKGSYYINTTMIRLSPLAPISVTFNNSCLYVICAIHSVSFLLIQHAPYLSGIFSISCILVFFFFLTYFLPLWCWTLHHSTLLKFQYYCPRYQVYPGSI